MNTKTLLITFALFFSSNAIYAETLYVTDRILLGVHQQASETSPVLESITSGTKVTVIQRNESFVKIKLENGKEGWVIASYLKKEKPATAELDSVYAQLQKAQETNKKIAEDLAKKEREVQVRRDEISNAKSTITDLRKALNEAGSEQPAVAVTDNKEADAQIKALEEKIALLEKEKSELADTSGDDAVIELEKLQNQNKEFQVRIEAALANLKGETVPSAAELAAIRPSFPFWYWLLLIAMLAIGATAGIFWIDYHHRRKHGGFRL